MAIHYICMSAAILYSSYSLAHQLKSIEFLLVLMYSRPFKCS